jgi:hypothetical protein
MSCHLKFLGARSGKLLLTLASVLALPEHVHTSLPLVTLLLRAVGEGARLYRMCARRSFPSEVAVSTLKHFALALRGGRKWAAPGFYVLMAYFWLSLWRV